MSTVLIAESGSTKTDWCLVGNGQAPEHLYTTGINPYVQPEDTIRALLRDELRWDQEREAPGSVAYYGAGAGSDEMQAEMKRLLQERFPGSRIEVQGDLMAAARGLCGKEAGIVCILGTGSNSCYFEDDTIKDQTASLGYLAGDEGSGNQMGRRVLQYYAYKTFDTELTMAFEKLFGKDLGVIMRRLYKEPFPNRYLAGFVPLLVQNRGHYMVENIIEDCLNDFFHSHILKYRESWKKPLHFTGSIAYGFRDVLSEVCHQYELELGRIEKTPLEGLIGYHSGKLI